MTVTGFNAGMIDGIRYSEHRRPSRCSVPGLQVGCPQPCGQERGWPPSDAWRCQRPARENFFQDSSVAVYIDGVYTPVSYGLDAGMFDVERIEVARGPPGHDGRQDRHRRVRQLRDQEADRRVGHGRIGRVYGSGFAALQTWPSADRSPTAASPTAWPWDA